MPWKETGPLSERQRLIADYASGMFSKSELAERYSVSRKSVDKWIKRYDVEGDAGLAERSRRPRRTPGKTAADIEQQIVDYRKRYPHRGPKKIIAALKRDSPEVAWPAASTAGDILERHGLIEDRRRRRAQLHPLGSRPTPATEPGDRITVDFKGQFRMTNGQYCYPLTIVDAYSRFILACEALSATEYQTTRRVFERVFREYGMPLRILSDNGTPFASTGLARLSQLNVWWIRLGLVVERIWPGRPDQNGSHERMHLELKQRTTRPPADNLASQQVVFDHFVGEYNVDRPHEGLGQKTPASIYVPPNRTYPEVLPAILYPGHFVTRLADHKGMISWRGEKVFLSEPLAGERLGFEEFDDGRWSIYFGSQVIGRFDERTRKVYG